MIKEKYLPLGTVVMLKNGKKKVMINGFLGVAQEKGNRIFDYIGCLYPEGIISSDKNLLFDHEQIETIYSVGYSDNDDIVFRNKISEMRNNYSSEDAGASVEMPALSSDNL